MGDEYDLSICVACGTQFDVPFSSTPSNCRICDDPRQYCPAVGQQWTSLSNERGKHENKFEQYSEDGRIWFITTEPKLGIGERAILIQTTEGNILWDLIAYIDQKTIDFINSKGGLKAIVISHPHFYTTHLEWAKAFSCPVYTSKDDEGWFNRVDKEQRRIAFSEPAKNILPGVTAVKVGGHFDGSLILHWEDKIFIADSMMIVPSGIYHVDRLPGTVSFSFMWSYPNLIPLPPSKIHGIWKAVKSLEFEAAFGGFTGQNVRSPYLKRRVLESMQINVRAAGHETHEIFQETVP